MNVMTADFEFVLPLIILIGIIASLIDKFKKSAEEAQRQQRDSERRAAPNLPEATRRQVYGSGEAPVRRARPLVPQERSWEESEGRNDTGDGTNGERVPQAPVQPRPARPVVVAQPAPTTPWGELRRQLEQGARGVEKEVRRQITEAQRRQGGPSAPTEYDREQQRRRQQHEAEQAQRRQAATRAAQPARPAQQTRPEAPRPAPPVRRATPPGRRRHPLLGDMSDIRHAIILREVLGPPRGLE